MTNNEAVLRTFREIQEAIAVLSDAAENLGAHKALKTSGRGAALLSWIEAREELMQAIHEHRARVIEWAATSTSS